MPQQRNTQSRQRQRIERWSAALLAGGFALLAASWVMEGALAFQTGDKSITVFGLPVDALGKTVIAVVIGFTGFAGAAVTAWLYRQDTTKARRQARLALAITAACVATSTFFLASYFGYAQRLAEYPKIAATPAYTVALDTVTKAAHRLATEPMGYEEEAIVRDTLARAEAVVRRGQKPVGSELPTLRGALWAMVTHLVAALGAAAYRLPEPRKPTRKKARAAASVTRLRVAN